MTVLIFITLLASWATVSLSPAAVSAQACTELVANGGFETSGGWELSGGAVPPQYVTYTAHSGTQSLQLGITSGANTESFSSARQTVTIPDGVAQATLSFWFYAIAPGSDTADYMELALLGPDGSVTLAKPWQSSGDSQVWSQLAFDLGSWQGQTFQIYFNVYNDGTGGATAMFVDDVTLGACGTAPVTASPPAATPAPTATHTVAPPAIVAPSPTPGCTELIRNGAFDGGLADWETVGDPAGVAIAGDNYHSSATSLGLGSLDAPLNGLAAVRQLVTIPATAPDVTLDVWIFTQSEPDPGADYQEIALLNAEGGLIYVPYRGPANDNAWVRLQFNLAAFAGQTVYLRFAVNNDDADGRTAMYVDDVRLTACSSGAAPAPLPAAPVQPPVFATEAAPIQPAYPPVAQPPASVPPAVAPAGCAELTQNGGFEAGFAGWAPGTNPLRPAVVTAPVLSGVNAAEMGSQTQNLNSYSSIRQTVTVPWGYARTFISFWTYTWAEAITGTDRQQFVLLGPGNVVWAVPWKVLESAQAWQQHLFEIVGVGGQTFDIYFGTVNDGAGGRTALYVDEVHLWGCSGAWPMTSEAQDVAQAEQIMEARGGPLIEMALQPQAVPVPQVYPVETLPAPAMPEQLSGAAAETPGVRPAQWTVVAIVTVVETPLPARAVAPAVGTLEPLAVIPTGAAALLGTVAPGTPMISVSLTPQPASFLTDLTANWPPNWPLILAGILVVVIIIVLIVRARQGP